jgi:hypothetical protein
MNYNFDSTFYKNLYDDLKDMSHNELVLHYINYGKEEGRIACKEELLEKKNVTIFDSEFYKMYYEDLKKFTDNELLIHYVKYGKEEGRIACKEELLKKENITNFNLDFYKMFYKELKNVTDNELVINYIKYGKQHNIICCKEELLEKENITNFDSDFYKMFYEDLKDYTENELVIHYVKNGKKEGRIFSKNNVLILLNCVQFNSEFYNEFNNLSNTDEFSSIRHYYYVGKKEELITCKNVFYEIYPIYDIEFYHLFYNIDLTNENELMKKYYTAKNKIEANKLLNFYKMYKYQIKKNKMNKEKIDFRMLCLSKINYIRNLSLPYFCKNSIYETVLIEYRCFPHLEFLIRNTIIKLGKKWSHTIICGNLNYKYMKEMCNNISPNIKVIKTDYNIIKKEEYSNFLLSLNFWNLLEGEKILIYHENTLIFKNNIEKLLEWEYSGTPWITVGEANINENIIPNLKFENSGLTLRNKHVMKDLISLLNIYKDEKNNGFEDSNILYNEIIIDKYHKEIVNNFSTDFILNKDRFGGYQFFGNEPNWKERIITSYNKYVFDYALVFICHDLYSFMNVKNYLNYDNCYIIFVGDKKYDILYSNKKVIIANDYEINIEKEKKLLTFTAWYLIVKNNLFEKFTHICLFEHDITFIPHFLEELNLIYKKYDVISFLGGYDSFIYDINLIVFNKFIKNKNINEYNIKNLWYYTTNHCIKRTVLVDFVNWYYPDCFYLKLYDYKNFSYYHERLFSVFMNVQNINCFLLDNYISHKQICSHNSSYNIKGKNKQKIFLTYNDNSNQFDEYTNHLIKSVEKYSDFEPFVYNKIDIDEYFKNQNSNILNEIIGGGYWLWKPYIILTMLNKLKENDILFYLDSKYYFVEEFSDLYEKDIVVWKNKPNEEITYLKKYCKMDVIQKYNINDLVFKENVECCWAGAMVIKKTDVTLNIINEWLEMCCDYNNITDIESIIPNDKEFISHRHDQSLLSIVLHKHNISMDHFPTKYLQNVRIPW